MKKAFIILKPDDVQIKGEIIAETWAKDKNE